MILLVDVNDGLGGGIVRGIDCLWGASRKTGACKERQETKANGRWDGELHSCWTVTR